MQLRKMFPCNPPHSFNLRTKHVFRYRFGFVRNGVKHLVTPWRNNLILDSGLDKVGSVKWADCWKVCLFGNQVAPAPVARNSGAVTFTTVGTAVTASGNFFSASDVGRLIKFDDAGGQERYITAFIDLQHVTLGIAPAPAIAGNTATIWYVNQTALQSLYATTSTYDGTGGANGTTAAGNVVTMKRTFIGAAVGAPVSLTEIGFNDSGANANLFDRDIIVGGVGLVTGDQPLAVAELITTWTPNVSTAAGNVGTGFDSSGNYSISALSIANGSGSSSVAASGATQGAGFLDPSIASQIGTFIANFTLAAFTSGAPTNYAGSIVGPTGIVNAAYTPGSFFRDLSGSFDVATSNGTIYGLCICDSSSNAYWQQKLTTTFVKLSTQTLSFTIRRSWQRILTN